MNISESILAEISQKNARLVAVTKYFSKDVVNTIFEQLKGHDFFYGCGENRIDEIKMKEIPRNFCHFIGNIQSRDISDIAQHCSVVHSLDSLKHAQKFAVLPNPPKVFLQINISNESQKGGIPVENLNDFLQNLPSNLVVLGLSAIGAKTFTHAEKSAEFLKLKALRDKYNPDWKISAGTSRDYDFALEEGIEIVRIGKKLFYEN